MVLWHRKISRPFEPDSPTLLATPHRRACKYQHAIEIVGRPDYGSGEHCKFLGAFDMRCTLWSLARAAASPPNTHPSQHTKASHVNMVEQLLSRRITLKGSTLSIALASKLWWLGFYDKLRYDFHCYKKAFEGLLAM